MNCALTQRSKMIEENVLKFIWMSIHVIKIRKTQEIAGRFCSPTWNVVCHVRIKKKKVPLFRQLLKKMKSWRSVLPFAHIYTLYHIHCNKIQQISVVIFQNSNFLCKDNRMLSKGIYRAVKGFLTEHYILCYHCRNNANYWN